MRPVLEIKGDGGSSMLPFDRYHVLEVDEESGELLTREVVFIDSK